MSDELITLLQRTVPHLRAAWDYYWEYGDKAALKDVEALLKILETL